MHEQLGKYTLDSLIAEGGMAQLYRAHSEGLGGIHKEVAIKRLRDHLSHDEEQVRMLFDEARLMAMMSHKNICQVYDLESDGSVYYVVMEYVNGADLSIICRQLRQAGKRLPEEAAIFIAIEALSGLSYAHRLADASGQPLHVIHRDINPQNILLSREGEVKLVDFGIAKAAMQSTEETQIGTLKGKFNYMSPEQARGQRVDQRSDVFAMGAVLYEMLTGEMLYPLYLDEVQLLQKIRMADFVPISVYLPHLHPMLSQILQKALARDVQQRFESSRDFLLALTQYAHTHGRLFDSLQLAQVVGKALAQPVSRPASGPVSINSEDTELVVEGGAGHQDSASLALIEEWPTKVYEKNDMQNIVEDLEKQYNWQNQAGVDLSVRDERATDTYVGPVVGPAPESGFFAALKAPLRHPLLTATIVLTLLLLGFVLYLIGTLHANRPILLQTEPAGAQIIINGQDSGLTTPSEVRPDDRVILRKPYFEDAPIDFSERKETGSVLVTLEPKMGRLTLRSKPERARIFIDDTFVGSTPHTHDLAKGHSYEVLIEKAHYRTEKRVIHWLEESQDEIFLDLELNLDE